MKRSPILVLILSGLLVIPEGVCLAEPETSLQTLKCRFSRKDNSFCKLFPFFSLRHELCNPQPEIVGNIEWCREDVTITDQDECGEWETYEATVITYRPVYCNGAWGKPFKYTVRKGPLIVTPPVIGK